MADVAISARADGTRVAVGDIVPLSRAGAGVRGAVLEGTTFTPAATFGGAAVGMTFSTAAGVYRRIGDLIFIERIQLIWSAKGSSTGSLVITGLPVAAATGQRSFSLRFVTTTIPNGHVQAYTAGTATTINIEYLASGVATPVDNTHLANTSSLIISGFYLV